MALTHGRRRIEMTRNRREETAGDIDRSHMNRCLSKAIAFKQTGQDEKAAEWARDLIRTMMDNDLLTDDDVRDTLT
jgi:hypothetical protein